MIQHQLCKPLEGPLLVHSPDSPINGPLHGLGFNDTVELGWASDLPKLQALVEIFSKTKADFLNLSLALAICFPFENISIFACG
jgi:hypothetical protein